MMKMCRSYFLKTIALLALIFRLDWKGWGWGGYKCLGR